jgi:exodeoxyribonuclease VII large subunit
VGDEGIYEIGQLFEELTDVIERDFGRGHEIWLRGEIVKVYEKGHLYIDVADAGTKDARRPTIGAHVWQSAWNRLRTKVKEQGIELQANAVVELYGHVDVYAPQGRIGFNVLDIRLIDEEGEHAKRRQDLINRLSEEKVIRANADTYLTPVPLHIGLVASKSTEGFADFTGQFLQSGFSFRITHVQATVQGPQAPNEIAQAIKQLDGNCDVIAVVRGGGSKTDLACFDDEVIARAIIGCQTPVFTGIGHTNDESVADLVAHTRAITPTKLGEMLVTVVSEWRQRHVVRVATLLLDYGSAVLEEAEINLGTNRRAVTFAVRDRLRAEEKTLSQTRQRLLGGARRRLVHAREVVDGAQRLLTAYDPQRRLQQGWAIVTDASGTVIKATEQVETGDKLEIRLSNGQVDVTVNNKNGAS